MTPEERRQARLNELASKLQHERKGKDIPFSFERTMAWGMMKWGCRKATMEDYLGVLAGAGLIEIERERDWIRWVGA